MVFFAEDEIDEKWALCKTLSRGRKAGKRANHESVYAKAQLSCVSDDFVIILYSREYEGLLEEGRLIVDLLEYKNDSGYLYFKTDKQTLAGTRATGQKKNYRHRVKLPTPYMFIEDPIPQK